MLEVRTHNRSITPQEPCYMGGYAMRMDKSTGVLDDLNCAVLSMKIDKKPLVFCSLDLILVDDKLVTNILKRISKEWDIDEKNIFIGATHTHAGPELGSSKLVMFDNLEEDDFIEKYEEFLANEVSNAILECLDGEHCKVEAVCQTVEINGVYGNRNAIGKPEDKDVSIIKFIDEKQNTKAAIINISCHPTVLGAMNPYISGDLLGYIARCTLDELGVYPIMMQGAAGDMSNRNYRKGHDENELIRTGMAIVEQMFKKEKYEKLELRFNRITAYNYYLEYQLDKDELLELRETTEKQMLDETDYDKHKILSSAVSALDMKLASLDVVCDFEASIINIGDLEICAHSGEMFSRFGMEIKSASKAKLPIIWGYVGSYSGYMTNEEDFHKNYESMMSPYPKGAAEKITADLCELISDNSNK